MGSGTNIYRGQGVRRLIAAIPLITLVVAFEGLLEPKPLMAGVTIQDISPDKSTFYSPTSAFGASGGRVNGVASVPGSSKIFYAATEWGGLFKTVDGGINWFRLDRHLPVATWDVKVDPLNTNTVYATSFYDGRIDSLSGIQVSHDDGNTWAKPMTATPSPDNPGVFACSDDRRTEPSAFGIGIHPDLPNTVVVGTNCGVAISDDAGGSWRFVDPTPGISNCFDGSDACDVWDVVVQPGGVGPGGNKNPPIIDICGDDGHYRSTDGGQTWTGGLLPYQVGLPPVSFQGNRCSMAVSPDEPYVLFVADDAWRTYSNPHSIWESDDGGQTWTNLGNPYNAINICPPPNGTGTRCPKRLPFLAANKRSDSGGQKRFDLWYGEQDLWRASCVTPISPSMGGSARCPSPTTWAGPFSEGQGAHGDSGDVVFDGTKAVDACPMIYSSDGGVFYNTDLGTDCQNPDFMQPNRSPHALWLWGMAGSNQPGGAVALHFGVQDDGSWATPNALATPPSWSDGPTSDSFTRVADTNRVVWLGQDGLHVQAPGLVGGPTVNTPSNDSLVSFRFINAVDQFGDRRYVVITVKSQVFITDDITASPVVWTELGAGSTPGNVCGVRASVDPANPSNPVSYIQAGSCNASLFDNSGDQLWKYVGAASGGTWQRIDNQGGMMGGIGIFGVDPKNPNRIYASNLRSPATGGPRMVFSNSGGSTWTNDSKLDAMMTGNTFFKYRTERGVTTDVGFAATFPGYPQPSLVAFDPEDPNIIVAGGRDSGLFLSTNGGQDWDLLTDPFDSGSSGIPHIPRPWFVHFYHDTPGAFWLFVGTQGRGVFRIRIKTPVANAGGPYSTTEGANVTLNAGGSSDPDGQPLDFEWDLDNDGHFDDATGPNPVFGQVGQDGVYTVRVKVSAGGAFSIATTTVTVTNVAPSFTLLSTASQPEGAPVPISGKISDPGWLDPLTATINWGDGSPVQPVSGVLENVRPDATLTFTTTHIYGDNGNYNVQVCGSDDDITTCQAISVLVTNVPPTVAIDTVTPSQPAPGEPVELKGSFTDPGWQDTHTAHIVWGDGKTEDSPLFDVTNLPPAGTGKTKATHTYCLPGTYSAKLEVKDDDGGTGSDTRNITADLSPDRPGMIKTDDMARFLTVTGTLPGTLGSAIWQWRNGYGAASLYWIYLNQTKDWLFFFIKGRVPKYDPSKSMSTWTGNFFAIAVKRSDFEYWFWCGMPLYDPFGRFTGYGCHPEWGPGPPEIFAPWIQQRIDQSLPEVIKLLAKGFGGSCP